MNNNAINLIDNHQLPYSPIYYQELVEWKILKIYIKINFVNDLIRLFKFSLNTSIFFLKKFNQNFRFCLDYDRLNNLTIEYQNLFFMICKSLD